MADVYKACHLLVLLEFRPSERNHCQQRQSKNIQAPLDLDLDRYGGFARSLLDAGSQFTIRNGHSAPRPAAAGDPESFLHEMPNLLPTSHQCRHLNRDMPGEGDGLIFPLPDRASYVPSPGRTSFLDTIQGIVFFPRPCCLSLPNLGINKLPTLDACRRIWVGS